MEFGVTEIAQYLPYQRLSRPVTVSKGSLFLAKSTEICVDLTPPLAKDGCRPERVPELGEPKVELGGSRAVPPVR